MDTVGLSVETVDVNPVLLQSGGRREYDFSVGFSEAGVEGGARRVRVREADLPDWARRSFVDAAEVEAAAEITAVELAAKEDSVGGETAAAAALDTVKPPLAPSRL